MAPMQNEIPHPPRDPAMNSPTPILMVVAGLAVLVLGSLFVTGLVWEAGGPATVYTSHASAPPAAAPATTPHG